MASAPQPSQTATIRFADTTASTLLDTLRTLAALLVVVGHWRYFFLVDFPSLTTHRALWYVPYLLCTAGHQAVMLFFVLSGYLVGGHALRAILGQQWNWSRYALQRGLRLYLVLVPALLLCAALDQFALHYNIAPALYHGQVANHLTYDVRPGLTLKAFVGNLLFVDPWLVPIFGSDSPLWSLACEAWYYLLFPCIMLVLLPGRSLLYRAGMAVVAFGSLIFLGAGFPEGFAIWLMGAALNYLPASRVSNGVRWLAACVYVPLFFSVTRGGYTKHISPDIVLGFATALLVWLLLSARGRSGNALWERGSRRIAAFSYTLYLVHVPILMITTGLLLNDQRMTPTAAHLALAVGVLLSIIAFAYGFAALTEFHTLALRRWLEKKLFRKQVA